MKVKVITKPELMEIEVDIRTPELDEETRRIEQAIAQATGLVRVNGVRNQSVATIPIHDAIRFYTADKHVFVETAQGSWQVKQRMHELAEGLPAADFVRINQGEIVNLSFVDHLDLSLAGTIGVIFSTGQKSFVSRRQLKAFKQALDL